MAYTTIDDPSQYFQTLLYTGNATGSRALTNDGNSDLQPDWLWIKQRNATKNHNIWDSTRGVTKQLRANLNNAEATNTTNDTLVSLNSDGFTLGDDTDSVGVNENSQTYVAWQWKANGGTTSSNTDGVITSTVQANQTAGFSIVKFDSTSASGEATVGHGLGAVPHVIIMKDLVQSYGWDVHHISAGGSDADGRLVLNTDEAYSNASNIQAFGQAGSSSSGIAPTSTTFSFNQGFYGSSGDAKIVYFFTPIQGYSKFGSYTGNGSADGPFVYLGFKPAWLMIKETSNADDWYIYDAKRSTINVINDYLQANKVNAEETTSINLIDFVSNGFKSRGTGGTTNTDGATYVYMAFAEHPFVSSEGVPVTAR